MTIASSVSAMDSNSPKLAAIIGQQEYKVTVYVKQNAVSM
jgi:hypothetical protein